MSKFRSIILIVGLLTIAVAAALLTVLVFYATGTIVTDPIELVYTANSDTKTYDGTPLTLDDNAYTLDSGEVLEGHTAQVKIIGSQTNAGTSESTLEVKIFDKKGFDVTDEYAVKVNTGTLTVEKCDVALYIESQEIYYSGKKVFFNECSTDIVLPKGHKVGGVSATLLNAGDTLSNNITPVIYDAFDNDVTDNYNINIDSMGEVKIVPRPLTIKPKDASKVYDGTPLIAEGYEIVSGSVAPGQTVKCNIKFTNGDPANFTNCTAEEGVIIKIADFEILDEDGKGVRLDNYDLRQEYALFTIEKRPVTIVTASETFTYNGEAQYNNTIQLFSGTFAPNQTFSEAESTPVTDVDEGEVDNKLISYEILDANGKSVGTNYKITVICGKLSVAPYNLTVYTKSYSKVYDGKKLGDLIDQDTENYELKVDLDPKFTLITDYSDTVKNRVDVIGKTSYSLSVASVKIGGEDGEEVKKDNFEITVKAGEYSITKKALTIKSISQAFVYNGTDQGVNDKSKYEVEGLVEEYDEIEFDDNYSTVNSVKDVKLNKIEYSITAKTDGEPAKDNYEITHYWGTLTVTPKSILITTQSKNQVYNGAALSLEGGTCNDLITGHNLLRVGELPSITNVGSTPNAQTFDIVDSSNVSVKENYEINTSFGTLTVTPKSVLITTQSKNQVYNGTALSLEGGTCNDLITGHNLLRVGELPSITNVGSTPNAQTFDIVDSSNVSVKDNYEINTSFGTLTVTKCLLTIKSASQSFVYNGAKQVCTEEDQTIGLQGADKMVKVANSGTEVMNVEGNIPNVFSYSIQNNGKDVTDNYDISFIPGVLTVTQKPVTVHTNGDEKFYDGEKLSLAGGYSLDLVAGHQLQAISDADNVPSITDVGILKNEQFFKILDGDGKDVTSNYSIYYDYGYLTVKHLPVTVTFKSEEPLSMDYRGYDSYYSDDAKIIAGLNVGAIGTVQAATFTKTLKIITVKSVTVYNDKNEDITSNLTINYEEADIPVTVNRCALEMTLGDYYPEYWTIVPGDIAKCVDVSTLAVGDTIDFTISVNEATNTYRVTGYKIMHGDNDVTDYYAELDLSATGKILQY